MKKKPNPRVIAFDLGGTKLASAVVDSQGAILAQHREFVEFGKGVEGFKKFLTDRALDWKRQFPDVRALGIASCGPLDPSRGVLLQPTNFPKWGDISLLGPLTRKLKLPVAFQNDAAAAALAEGWVGGARSMRNWIVLTLGTGVGTGIVMDRKPFMGGSGFGPEAGHQIVTDKPYPCGCGNTGCAESVLSGTGLRNRIKELKLPIGGSHALVEAARGGDAKARQVFAEYATILARLIHNLSVPYKPDAIFFSGGLAEAHDLFLDSAKAQAEKLLAGRPGFMPKLRMSKLGNDLGILGGANMGLEVLNG